MKLFTAAAAIAALALPHALAQTTCQGTTLAGVVRDSTLALIPGAALSLDGVQSETSGSDGRFRFSCVSGGSHSLSATASGFARRDLPLVTPHTSPLELVLQPEEVETQVNVSSEGTAMISPESSGPTQTISGNRLQSLADDPDDLLRELQQLAAAGGGSAANTTIAVDGFQDSTALPPKSSIAYIKVNPDLYAAEYRQPPFDGGRIEIYTKPGQKVFHGALFTTNGSPWENARDPFSTGKAALGKQRYGLEFSGPVRKTGSDFALTLEHRSIDNFAAVNAVAVDSAGVIASLTANVPQPQRLWLGTAKLDWQLGPKNTFIASYNANVSHLANVGVGGVSLAEAGYDSGKYDHTFRLSNITTASARLMHETRLSLRWSGEVDVPSSTATQVQVAGAFTGGGATIGLKQIHKLTIEADDDAILTPKNHTLKFGTQVFIYNDREQLPTSFNGTYNFGGGTAPVLDANNMPVPGQTETITGVQQYQRALLGLPSGSATAFTNVVGVPGVAFTQIQAIFFIEDDWNAGHGFHIASGLRYAAQNDPTMLNAITPRLGVLWSPNQKGTWTLHAHTGMFAGQLGGSIVAEMLREDGVARVTSTIYNPVCPTPFNPITCNPFAGATPVHSIRQYSPHIDNLLWATENIGGTRALPHGFNFSADWHIGRFWRYERTENINSPLNDSPTGPRPGAPNLNILQMQNSGQGRVNATFASIEQRTLKHFQFLFGAVRVELVDDTDDNPLFTPQSSSTNAGEFAHRSNQSVWNLFGNGMVTFPRKIQLSGDFHANGDAHYNITTGFDNNGDGNFNDRPQYAATGTPGAIATPYGLLVASGGTGVFPRNKGAMPWTFYLDTNLQRAFALTRNGKAEHPQTLTINLRSANVLNHTNVTAVGGVLGSPLFGVPFAADNGRRVEAGLRYSF